MRLTPHFTLHELTYSDKAIELGIPNVPTKEHLKNLQYLAQKLEEVRKILGNNPMIGSSGYRAAAVNKAVGGVPTSDHALGFALDFTCPRFGSVKETCEAIRDSGIRYDQLIFEQRGSTHWVHISFAPRMRQQTLSWSPATGYRTGIHTLGAAR